MAPSLERRRQRPLLWNSSTLRNVPLSCRSVAGRSGATTTVQCSKMLLTYVLKHSTWLRDWRLLRHWRMLFRFFFSVYEKREREFLCELF